MSSACRTTTLLSSTSLGKVISPMHYHDDQTTTRVNRTTRELFIQSTTLACLFSHAGTLSTVDERLCAHQLQQPDLLDKWATTYPLTQSDSLLWYGDRLVIMEDSALKRGVIPLYHDSVIAGHPRISNTMWAIAWDLWWPMMKKDITEYVKGCAPHQIHLSPHPLYPSLLGIVNGICALWC